MARTPIANPQPPDRPEPRFRLETLGAARLVDAQGQTVLASGILLALLVYLHAAERRALRREHLADVFWRLSSPRHGKASLRQSLTRLRHLLGEAAFGDSGGELCLRVPLDSDRDRFLEALAAGRLEEAVGLYGGDFFPDFGTPGSAAFEQWVDLERAQLRARLTRAAESLIRQHLDDQRAADGLALALAVRRKLPENDLVDRLVVECYLAQGNTLMAAAELDAVLARCRAADRAPDAATEQLRRRVRAAGDARAEADAGPPGPPLVGREREFHEIVAAWNASRRGDSRHLHLEAAAGYGKTRLVTEALVRIRAEGGRAVLVRAGPADRTLQGALAARLAAGLSRLPGAKGVAAGSAAVLLGLNPALSATYPSGAGDGSATPLARLLAFEDLVRAVAEEGPLALVADDVHWMDAGSRQLMESLVAGLKGCRVLFLTAGRPLPRADGWWPDAVRLAVPPLTPFEIGLLLDGLGSFETVAARRAIAGALHEATGGSPLLVLEALSHADQAGVLSLSEGRWMVPEPDASAARIRTLGRLEHRVAQLSGGPRLALLTLAVAGRRLSSAECSALTSLDDAPAVLGDLERRGYLVHEEGAWDISNEHIALAVTAAATIEERRAAHLATARYLAPAAGTPGEWQLAGAHFLAAGRVVEAQPLFRRWARAERRAGDRRSARALADQFASGLDGAETLAAGLPAHLRHPVDWRQAAALAALMVVVGMGIVGAVLTPARTVPDARFAVVDQVGDSTGLLRWGELRRDGWLPGRPVETPRKPGARLLQPVGSSPPVLSPSGRDVLYSAAVDDSGAFELFQAWLDGSARRLTHSAGDDIDPSWSPDGAAIVFSTGRWTPMDDRDYDLAILQPATGQIRPLTLGPEADRDPAWSPDGTRIGFIRFRPDTTGSRVCWTTPGGQAPECPLALSGHGRLLGWRGPSAVLVQETLRPDSTRLIALHLDSARATDVVVTTCDGNRASPDGQWFLLCELDATGLWRWGLAPASAPGQRRPVEFPDAPHRFVWDLPRPASVMISRIRVTSDTAHAGVPHRLSVQGESPDGQRVLIPPGTVRWRSSDPSAASVDSITGWLVAHRPGRVEVIASAGGWRTDTALIEVTRPELPVTHLESWADTSLAGWIRFGEPMPRVVEAHGGRWLLNDGDHLFVSGAISPPLATAQGAAGVEAVLRTPVLRPKWQSLSVRFAVNPYVMRSGVGAEVGLCGLSLPVAEGTQWFGTAGVGDGVDQWLQAPRPDLVGGEPWTLRLQLFPDGTCGVAVNGRPLYRSSHPHPWAGALRLVFAGQSVGTRILVGPIQYWSGVRTDIDWGVAVRSTGVPPKDGVLPAP